jgi:hypothetical protein
MFNCILNLDYHIIDLVELAIYIDLAELVRRCNLSVQRERERERERAIFPNRKVWEVGQKEQDYPHPYFL